MNESPETKTPVDPRDSAIAYVIRRIAGDPAVYWHFLGTESWTRLLDAYSVITGKSVTDLHLLMAPDEDAYREQCEIEHRRANLDSGGKPRCGVCESREEYDALISEQAFRDTVIPFPPVLDAWESLPDYDRRRILSDLAASAY